MKIKNTILILFLVLAAIATPAFAANSVKLCINGAYLDINTTTRQIVNGVETNTTTYEKVTCPLGCSANSNYCTGQATNNGAYLPSMLVFIIMGIIFFWIATAIVDEDDADGKQEGKSPMKALFFFAGLMSLIGVILTGKEMAYDSGLFQVANLLQSALDVYIVILVIFGLWIILSLIIGLQDWILDKKKKRALGVIVK